MRRIRQFALLVSLMFWQGGFMFYGGVVVPVGGRILGSETAQGFITQSVTNYLNLAGVICLMIWATELWIERSGGVSKIEWFLLLFAAVSLAYLEAVHLVMDQILKPASGEVSDGKLFSLCHKQYIGVSSLQWLASLLLLFLTIRRWDSRVRQQNSIPD